MENLPIKKIDVSCIIPFNKKGEFLLQKKTIDYPFMPGMWAFFGGAIEESETPEQAGKRELDEELKGMDFDQFKHIKIVNYEDNGPNEIRKGKIYLFGGVFKEDLSELSIREGGGFALFSEEELDSIPIMPHLKELLKEI